MITTEMLDTLERRYTPADQQKCVVCGAPLTFAASDRFGSKYVCSSDDASPVHSSKPLRERLDHWERSYWYDRNEASPAVVELVRAYRELTFPRVADAGFDAIIKARVPDSAGDGDRWEDSRDTSGGAP